MTLPGVYRFLAYVAAWLAGLTASWWVLAMTAGRYFAPDLSARAEWVLLLGFLAPMAGLAAIQLVLGLSIRRWRGWRFWLIAPPLVYGVIGLGFAGIFAGFVTLIEGLVLGLLALFVLGWVILNRSGQPSAPRADDVWGD